MLFQKKDLIFKTWYWLFLYCSSASILFKTKRKPELIKSRCFLIYHTFVDNVRYLWAANMPRPRSVSIIMKSLQWDIFILFIMHRALNYVSQEHIVNLKKIAQKP